MAYNFIKTPPKTLPDEKPDIPDMEALLNGMAEVAPQDDTPATQSEEIQPAEEIPTEENAPTEEPPAPTTEEPVEEPVEQVNEEPTTSLPTKTFTEKKAKHSAGKKAARKSAADDAAKDKCSIYLPEDISIKLRMASVLTRRKNSYIAEIALRDLLTQRYQCQNPACYIKFSLSETEEQPTRCPVCGEERLKRFFIDR